MKHLDYNQVKNDFTDMLSKEHDMAFATSYKDDVTVRTVFVVSQGLRFFLVTRRASNKFKQIQRNTCVGLAVGAFQIKGQAHILGHPLDESNQGIMQTSLIKGPDTFKRYFKYKNAVLVEIIPSLISMWDTKSIYLDCEHTIAYMR